MTQPSGEDMDQKWIRNARANGGISTNITHLYIHRYAQSSAVMNNQALPFSWILHCFPNYDVFYIPGV